ncbi:MAG: TetR family transcriptional regulator [Meiothermus sp.]|nr:TetR family transcriptional regulator [Meiothermus sp.]
MSKLRARNTEDKEARREQILAEALAMWEEVDYSDFTMGALAARLGLAKGTLYLYFPTKEELFLTVFERLLGEWFDLLEARLARGQWGAPKLARLFAETLAERPELARLFPLLEGILEHNITLEKARAYKGWLLGRAAPIAARLEQHLGLGEARGVRALAYAQALVSGLRQMSDHSPEVREALDQPPLSVLRVEFHPDLEAALAALFAGLREKP